MILITRLNQQCFHVNPDLIKTIEQLPHTVLTLINGEKLVTREGAEEIIARIAAFKRRILAGLEQETESPGRQCTAADQRGSE
jgi:flagellar protein FlbD